MMKASMDKISIVLKYISITTTTGIGLYATFILLLTRPSIQKHAVYLHKLPMPGFQNRKSAEEAGFLRNQVTSFFISNPDGHPLHAWHILPLGLYLKNEEHLLQEPTGLVADVTSRLAFKLLQEDPEARLIIHLHGAGGTIGTAFRIPNYRALSAGDPDKTHVLVFDYRGFGRSPGSPSERGLVSDALAIIDWAMNTAGIPPSRILLFGQSLGCAVTLATSTHLALQSPPVVFAGTVLVAPFSDIRSLMTTYKFGGIIPLASPLVYFPFLFGILKALAHENWSPKEQVEAYTRVNEASGMKYQLTIIHAEDDEYVPWNHTPVVFWHAVNGTIPNGISFEELEIEKRKRRIDMGASGSVVEWRSRNGVIREEIVKHGNHDLTMGYPAVSAAVSRMFRRLEPLSSSISASQ